MLRPQTIALAALITLLVVVAGCARLADSSVRADAAWGARLTAQAEAHAEADARQERASAAWTARLDGLAERAAADRDARRRADEAWTARLNGLADHVTADR
jgi:hypothetical protein